VYAKTTEDRRQTFDLQTPARSSQTRFGAEVGKEKIVQPIRHRIIEILKENGTATVAELAIELGMAQVSVRHHLDILIGEDLVTASGVRRRNGAGRPSQIYALAPGASKLFPQAHEALAGEMLREIKIMLPPDEVKSMFRRLAERAARDAPPVHPGQSLEDRLDQVADFLSEKGYTARWEARDGRYELYTCNCPYAGVADRHPEVCEMDHALVQSLIPAQTALVRCEGGHSTGTLRCTYAVEPRAEPVAVR
jgi:predicted ArsR family transcriptional regulator